LAAGAQIINDISGLRHDAAMVEVAVSTGAGVVLMHMQGQPGTMQMNPHYDDVVREIHDFFESRLQVFDAAGMDRAAVVLDPGIGFGKRFEDNWRLLARLPELAAGGLPLLLGVSRKRFLGELCDRPVDERLPASLAALTATILAGAAVVRVHDVKESCDAARVADRLRAETEQHGGMDTTTALA
jgi:dihydropteroate synthase